MKYVLILISALMLSGCFDSKRIAPEARACSLIKPDVSEATIQLDLSKYRDVNFGLHGNDVVIKYNDYLIIQELLVRLGAKIEKQKIALNGVISYYDGCFGSTKVDSVNISKP